MPSGRAPGGRAGGRPLASVRTLTVSRAVSTGRPLATFTGKDTFRSAWPLAGCSLQLDEEDPLTIRLQIRGAAATAAVGGGGSGGGSGSGSGSGDQMLVLKAYDIEDAEAWVWAFYQCAHGAHTRAQETPTLATVPKKARGSLLGDLRRGGLNAFGGVGGGSRPSSPRLVVTAPPPPPPPSPPPSPSASASTRSAAQSELDVPSTSVEAPSAAAAEVAPTTAGGHALAHCSTRVWPAALFSEDPLD